jgi:hypothetical protein
LSFPVSGRGAERKRFAGGHALQRRIMRKLSAFLLVSALLSGCGEEPAVTEPEDDPALSGALNEPIMVDPDLVGQNRANSAASLPSHDDSLPTVDSGPEAIAAARAEALQLVGGPGWMKKAPEPREVSGPLPADAALTIAARASTRCAARVETTAGWAARLPAPFPVYPRGAVQEAAGTDTGNCALRVVSFVTPAPLGEVMDFYFTRARTAGFSAQRLLHEGDDVLAGVKGAASYVIYARRLRSGNTEVDLVTSGGLGG